jgi:hypothetical protein
MEERSMREIEKELGSKKKEIVKEISCRYVRCKEASAKGETKGVSTAGP